MGALFKKIQRPSDFDIDRQVGVKQSRWGEVGGSKVEINGNLHEFLFFIIVPIPFD